MSDLMKNLTVDHLRANVPELVTKIESAVTAPLEVKIKTLEESLATSEKERTEDKIKLATFEAVAKRQQEVDSVRKLVEDRLKEKNLDSTLVAESDLKLMTPYLLTFEEGKRASEVDIQLERLSGVKGNMELGYRKEPTFEPNTLENKGQRIPHPNYIPDGASDEVLSRLGN